MTRCRNDSNQHFMRHHAETEKNTFSVINLFKRTVKCDEAGASTFLCQFKELIMTQFTRKRFLSIHLAKINLQRQPLKHFHNNIAMKTGRNVFKAFQLPLQQVITNDVSTHRPKIGFPFTVRRSLVSRQCLQLEKRMNNERTLFDNRDE